MKCKYCKRELKVIHSGRGVIALKEPLFNKSLNTTVCETCDSPSPTELAIIADLEARDA